MADLLVFHHALGLTPGCVAFADELRTAGHIVHMPDLYDGKVFKSIREGVAYAGEGSSPDYDEGAAKQLRQRVLEFLAGLRAPVS